MQDAPTSMPLTACIRACEASWLQEYEQLARQDNTEALIIYGEMLLKGAGNLPANQRLGVSCLQQAAKHSAEAALKLAKMYLKGKRLNRDLIEAYFYCRIAMLFKCKCGKYKEVYHSGRVSSAHPCFPTEAKSFLTQITVGPEADEEFRERYYQWRDRQSPYF